MHRHRVRGNVTRFLVKQQRHVLMQRPLIAFEPQDVIPALIHDRLGNSALVSHRVKGHDHTL